MVQTDRFFHNHVAEKAKFWLNSLRFDDKAKRGLRGALDKVVPIRNILEKVGLSPYSGENVVIYGMMKGFRGKCPFRHSA